MGTDERVYLRGRIYWCWYYDAQGALVRESTLCRDKKAAVAYQRERERSARDPGYAATRAATLEDALKLLIADRLSRAQATPPKGSLATVEFYRVKAGHLARLLQGSLQLITLSATDVDGYIANRRSEGAHEGTIAKELVTLRASLKLAKRAGKWRGDPGAVLPVGFAPEYEPRQRWLTREEAWGLLRELGDDRAARVAFVLATSAERGATDRAERRDVDPEGPTRVFLRGTKRATRKRVVPLVTEEQRALVEFALQHGRGEGGLLFAPWACPERDLAAACRRLGCRRRGCNGHAEGNRRVSCTRPECAEAAPARCTLNDLRRTFAHWMRQGGLSLELLAPMMGHSTTVMVQRVYGKLTPDELAARASIALGLTPPAPTPGDCETVVKDPASFGALDAPHAQTGEANPPVKTASSGGPSGTRTQDQWIKSPAVILPKPRKSRVQTYRAKRTVKQLCKAVAGDAACPPPEHSTPPPSPTPTRGRRA